MPPLVSGIADSQCPAGLATVRARRAVWPGWIGCRSGLGAVLADPDLAAARDHSDIGEARRYMQIGQAQASGRRTGLRTAGRAFLVVGILALAFNLRSMITGLPPVFPELQSVLHISAASLAVLAAVPVLCFGVFSGSGAPLSRRYGEERVLCAAVLLIVAGLLLRSLVPSALLFPGTIVAGGGIALMNVLLPSLVKRRVPERAGLVIGLYLLALSAGAIAASALAVPVFTAAGGGLVASRLILGLWAGPAVIAVLIWLPQLRFRTMPEGGQARPVGALAMRRHALAWQVTLFMGLQSLAYYAALSWFPTMFRDRGVSAAYAGTLLALMNLGNAVTALVVPVLAQRARDQRWLAVMSVGVSGIGLAGAGFAATGLAPAFMLLLGLGQGACLALGIYYTMARAPDPVAAASLSSFAQGAGYLIASTGPLLIGLLHTVTGGWSASVSVLLGVGAAQLVTGWLAGRALTVPTG
jgi:MFS transporter, CP family, cyanate transporter